jgi:hypothetical protein
MLKFYAWRAWQIISILALAAGLTLAMVRAASAELPDPCFDSFEPPNPC